MVCDKICCLPSYRIFRINWKYPGGREKQAREDLPHLPYSKLICIAITYSHCINNFIDEETLGGCHFLKCPQSALKISNVSTLVLKYWYLLQTLILFLFLTWLEWTRFWVTLAWTCILEQWPLKQFHYQYGIFVPILRRYRLHEKWLLHFSLMRDDT